MNCSVKLRKVALGCALMAVTNLLMAQVSVTSRGALGATDSLDWGKTGTEFDALGASFNTTTSDGLGVAVSGATSSFNGFERADQGSSWGGNFAPKDKLLWTGFGSAPQTMTIEFASPVFGAGAQIQNDFLTPGAFTALLTAYDSFGAFLFSDTFAGNSTDAGDNSAIFIGVLNNVENIGKIELSIRGSESFAINRLDLNRTLSVHAPEGGEYLMTLMVLGLFGMRLMFKSRTMTA